MLVNQISIPFNIATSLEQSAKKMLRYMDF